MDTYKFKNLKVQYGNITVLATGYAHFELCDIGEGHYEFWGEKGKEEYLVAYFDKCVLQDYNLKAKKSTVEMGLTHIDRKNIENLIIEMLNEDTGLCIDLAIQDDPEEKN